MKLKGTETSKVTRIEDPNNALFVSPADMKTCLFALPNNVAEIEDIIVVYRATDVPASE